MPAGDRQSHLCPFPLRPQYPWLLLLLSPSFNMSLIYSDSFRDDEDLCNVLAAFQLGDRPAADTSLPTSSSHTTRLPNTCQSSGVVVNDIYSNSTTQDRRSPRQERVPKTPAVQSPSLVPLQRRAPNDEPPSKYLELLILFHLAINDNTAFTVRAKDRPTSNNQNPVYNVASGKCTGIRNTWYIV